MCNKCTFNSARGCYTCRQVCKDETKKKESKGSKVHVNCDTKSLSISLPEPLPLDENFISENDDISEIECRSIHSKKPESNPNDPLDDDPCSDSISQKSSLLAKNQKTLLEFAKPSTTVLENDTSIKQVIDAVAELSLKVDSIGKQRTTFLQLAFEDNDVRRSVSAMRKAENILELTESTQLLEWFYDEATECAVLQCLPCFELSIAAKPTLAKLTPLKAQQLLNPKSNGTLSSGLFVKKESTTLLIKGHNQTWYRQKCLCIDHMCLIGGGSLTHKKAKVEFNKKLRHNERVTTTTGNIFRAAIVDLKVGVAGVQFETLISFLACFAVDVGSHWAFP